MFTTEVELTRTLSRIMPRSTEIVDYKENGDGDAVLLCHDSLRIVDRGVSGQGPHFTRQPWYRNRFDQSHLDRFYLSKRGEWVYHIRSVDHQGARTLSDHVPIKLEVILKEVEPNARPRRSYFKMEHKILRKPKVLERAKVVLLEYLRWAKDKRKKWSLALGRIRKLLMEVRDEDKRSEEEGGTLEEMIETARRRIQHDHLEEARKQFEEIITEQRKKAHEEVESCRRRCKITWLKEGEAPSKYFFARMKAKYTHEEMTTLEDSTGRVIEGREEILRTIHKFYEELYTAEPESDEMLADMRHVVGRIDKRLTAEQNLILEAVPSDELITTIVMEMPKEKSPSIDGVMVEILKIGWEFMKEDCFAMVQCFWEKKKACRNIIDNILSLRLEQEWAQVSEHDVIFVKLDVMKAYDRIAHGFLWDTLSTMGMGEDSLDRIRGLVIGGTSKVHVNGCFT
ncbi:hypothetical protein R1sor_013697 [Riccia sorocarpa]|uniref:Reverse transcriptase domain-containing protein n=1 Tax=Riccia sorocarpa TaxID=122646 RepID=A0ABD3H7G2_9MARC